MAALAHIVVMVSTLLAMTSFQPAETLAVINTDALSNVTGCTSVDFSGALLVESTITKISEDITGLPDWVSFILGPIDPVPGFSTIGFPGVQIFGPTGQGGIGDTFSLGEEPDDRIESNDWCRIMSTETLPDPVHDYQYNIRFRLIDSEFGPDYGQPGMAYNVQDSDNFDFVMMRFAAAECDNDNCIVCKDVVPCTRMCIQYGYMLAGTAYYGTESTCQYVTLVDNILYRLRLVVRGAVIKFAINNAEYAVGVPHFPQSNRVGVFLPDGLENILNYKSAQIQNFP